MNTTEKREPPYPLCTNNVFVLHVKNGYEKREQHIKSMLGNMGIQFEWILGGDIGEIGDETLARYFKGDMADGNNPATSCALKHLSAYQEIIVRNLDGGLVLEDDIILHKPFASTFNKSVDELATYGKGKAIIISYEDTRLRFVPRSKREKGKLLYEGDRDRMTGAYYINRYAAERLCAYATGHKLDQPIDLIICRLLKEGTITYLWCQPCIATQGSSTGLFKSSISPHKQMIRRIKWKIMHAYKTFLYFIR